MTSPPNPLDAVLGGIKDIPKSPYLRLILFGLQGTGKTTTAHRLGKRVLRIATDAGGSSLDGEFAFLNEQAQEWLYKNNPGDLKMLVDAIRADHPRLAEYDTIIFDNVSDFQRGLTAALAQTVQWPNNSKRPKGTTQNKQLGPHVENPGNDDHYWVSNYFRKMVEALIQSRKHVIFISQQKVPGNQDQDKTIRPDLGDSNRNLLAHNCQAVGMCFVDPKTKERMIDFTKGISPHAKSWIHPLTDKKLNADQFVEILTEYLGKVAAQ